MKTTYIVEITVPVKHRPSHNKRTAELQTTNDRQVFMRNLNEVIKIAGKDAKAKLITEV